jgi:Cu2+-exporting ATPase
VLRLAAIAEHKQTHPIARAILEAARQRGLDLDTDGDVDYKVGYGLLVKTRDGIIRVGSSRYIEGEQLTIPAALRDTETHAHQQGHSLVLVALDDRVIGGIELHASVREEAPEVIRGLRARGVETIHIISGDHQHPTRILAESLGLDSYSAGVLPEHKAEIVTRFQSRGKTVCFIGDGINDSIALKQADISVSLKGASTVATDTAQIVLMDESLHQLCPLFELASAHDSNARSTFGWVLAPHCLSLAGALFLHFGLIETIVFNQMGLILGSANAMLPRLRYVDRAQASSAPRSAGNFNELQKPRIGIE